MSTPYAAITWPEQLNPTDPRQPQAARVRSYALGDGHHFAADRAVWQRVLRVYPQAQHVVTAHHSFLRRAVQHLIETGARQILHLGSGLPTWGAAHEIAADLALDRGADLGVRVLYADTDPVVAIHGKVLLGASPRTRMVGVNPRHPARIVRHPEVVDFVDFAEPVAVLISAGPPMPRISELLTTGLRELADALVTGSHLAITQFGPQPGPKQDRQRQAVRVLAAAGLAAPIRSAQQLTSLLEDAGFRPLPPGVAPADQWLPDPDDPEEPAGPAALAVIAAKAPPDRHSTAADRSAANMNPTSPDTDASTGQYRAQRLGPEDSRTAIHRHLTVCR